MRPTLALAALLALVFGRAAPAAELACLPTAPVLGRAGARAFVHLTSLGDQRAACALTPDEQATFDAFRPGPSAAVQNVDEALRFDRPVLTGGADVRSDCAQQNAVLACAERYGDAMKTLEIAVAYAAVKDPAVLAMARRLAKRLELVVRARATREVLGEARRAPNGPERERIERVIDARLARAYGGCTIDQAGCLGHGCKAGDPGCARAQAHDLRAALGQGNLRETMFFLYLSNAVLTESVSRPVGKGEDPARVTRENQAQVAYTNDFVRAQGQRWQLTDLPVSYETPFILARTGYGADNNRMRDWRTLEGGKTGCVAESRVIREAPVPSLAMIPLSPRESGVLAERLGVDSRRLADQPTPYHSGESCFQLKREIADPKYAKYNDLLKDARDTKLPMLTGISGTTDSLMTLGRTLGLHSREDFELLRAAALGWLVSSRDHSVHEVMTAASSFKELAPYRFRPDAYKTMLPGRPGFAKDVEAYQRAHGQPLPAKLLETCLTTHEARR